MSPKRLLFFVTEDWYFHSHRLDLALAAKSQGFDVYLLCNINTHKQVIESKGIKVIPIDIHRATIGLSSNFTLLMAVIKIFKAVKPDIVHNVAQKPVLIGSLAAKICRVPKVVNALGGLGFVFSSRQYKARVLKILLSLVYRFLFRARSSVLIVQNKDDYQFFKKTINLPADKLVLILGAGVDTKLFPLTPFPLTSDVKITLVSRMLKDKGIGEFIAAAKIVCSKVNNVKFLLVGDIDPKNPNSYTENELSALVSGAEIDWVGYQHDIVEIWQDSCISVLPSYREGLPKSLLESASVGRPIITTNVPGCREVVKDGVNGFLVPLYSVKELSDKMLLLVEEQDLREKMGINSRKLVEAEFSSDKIIEQTLTLYSH